MYTQTHTFPPGSFGVFDLGGGSTLVDIRVKTEPAAIVHAFVVDASNLLKFRNGETFAHYGPGAVADFHGHVILKSGDSWHLVVENRNEYEIQVEVGSQRSW